MYRAGPSRGFEFAAFVRVSSGQSSAPHTKATRDRFNLSKVSAGHHANEEMKKWQLQRLLFPKYHSLT